MVIEGFYRWTAALRRAISGNVHAHELNNVIDDKIRVFLRDILG